MKLLRYLFIIGLVMASVFSADAQRFLGFAGGGMNLSQVDGDEVVGYNKAGGHLSLGVSLPIRKKWDVTLETVFSQKGAREKAQYIHTITDSTVVPVKTQTYTGEYTLKLNYVEVPLTAHYTDKEKYTVGMGFSYGRLVNSKEIEHGGNIAPYSDTVKFRYNDWNVIFDLQFRIWKQLKGNIRFNYSIFPIRERVYKDVIYGIRDPYERKQYNHLFTVRLIYFFNEKYNKNTQPEDLTQ
ncbi:MAG: outer membrane beta-barrel protein [Bacteroidales bacterium]|nr:outer membrane beta-barrel protein [Bacteroidales bacterium]